MSTILDALKKSEQERKQQRVPTLKDSPPPPEAVLWPWVLVVLAIALLALGLFYVANKLPTDAPTNDLVTSSSSSISSADLNTDEGEIGENQMTLSVISFSQDPAQRFAVVNDELFREGDYLRAGLRLVEIKSDSAVFDDRGQRIELAP